MGPLSRSCWVLGCFMVLVSAYRLWGTGLVEVRSQDRLRNQFELTLQARPAALQMSPVDMSPPPPPSGAAVAILKIPYIDVDQAVVEGTGPQDLKKGPGHYSGTAMPGEPGNVAIAGHRTTYGHPFLHLDQLKVADPILITTRAGTFRYEVTGHLVIMPKDNRVLMPTPDNRLTLTTCHPPTSAVRRFVVTARLIGDPVAPAFG